MNKFIIEKIASVNVNIGAKECSIQEVSDGEIKCLVGRNSAAAFVVSVKIMGKGFANNDKIFNYNLAITSISNTQSKLKFY